MTQQVRQKDERMRRIWRIISNNFTLKLVSVLVAIFIWYLVVYNNDPVQTASYTVRVEITNESYIENGKQLYMIDEQYKTVTVFVTANRSTLADISSNDISVTGDLTQIVDLERDPVVVPLSVTCDGIDPTKISLSRNTIPITIENVASKELVLSVSTGESEVNRNYEIGTTTVSPSSIMIYGPESVIGSIDSVVAEVDVSGLSRSTTLTGDLIFIDKNQEEISQTILEDDITIEGGEPKVTVDVELWKKVSDVAIEVEYSGTPEDGYQVGNISTTPETITIAGSDEALEELEKNGNKITIPAEAIDVSGLSADLQTDVDITEFLPEDTKLASSMSETVTVNVTILPNGSMEYAMDVDDITVQNLSDSLSVSYDKQEIMLRISGDSDSLDKISSSTVKAAINLTGKTVGDYTVPLSVTLPSGCSLLEDATISIHIKEGAEVTSS